MTLYFVLFQGNSMTIETTSQTFLGTIDDVVLRYPWKFQVDDKYFRYSLASQLLSGRKVLLHDGYLINHPVARAALQDKKHLLRLMLERGAAGVVTRGYALGSGGAAIRRFGLHEVPQRMKHIGSFAELVAGRTPGVSDFSAFQSELARVDRQLVDCNAYLSWSPYHTGSGYVAFVEKLLDTRATAKSVGLGRLISTTQLHQFLRQFRDRLLEQENLGPRNCWEILAKEYSEDTDVTLDSVGLLNGLMRLANEIYHYNFSVGLASAYSIPLNVETQPSEAFDDLLLGQGILVEKVSELPGITIPRSITDVPPDKLIEALSEATQAGRLRLKYLRAVADAEKLRVLTHEAAEAIKWAARDYGEELASALGPDMKFGELGSLFDFAFSEARSTVKTAAVFGATHWLTGEPLLAGAAAVGTAWLVFKGGERAKPIATKRFRIFAANKAIVPPEIIKRSSQTVAAIRTQRAPISLALDPKATQPLVSKMRLFQP